MSFKKFIFFYQNICTAEVNPIGRDGIVNSKTLADRKCLLFRQLCSMVAVMVVMEFLVSLIRRSPLRPVDNRLSVTVERLTEYSILSMLIH